MASEVRLKYFEIYKILQELTKREVNFISILQVPLAKEAGLCYAAVALVTDYDCWREMDDSEHVSLLYRNFCFLQSTHVANHCFCVACTATLIVAFTFLLQNLAKVAESYKCYFVSLRAHFE